MGLLVSNHKAVHLCDGIDLMLTNSLRSFHNTSLKETGLSHCHKKKVSVFRAFFKRPPGKAIEYWEYKTFDHNEFLRSLNQKLIKCNSYNDEKTIWHIYINFSKGIRQACSFKNEKNLEETKLNLWINQGLKINI